MQLRSNVIRPLTVLGEKEVVLPLCAAPVRGRPPRKEVTRMKKEEILKALKDEELKSKLLKERELEVEELEERVATKPFCFMPVP
jgi:hypothetical protein